MILALKDTDMQNRRKILEIENPRSKYIEEGVLIYSGNEELTNEEINPVTRKPYEDKFMTKTDRKICFGELLFHLHSNYYDFLYHKNQSNGISESSNILNYPVSLARMEIRNPSNSGKNGNMSSEKDYLELLLFLGVLERESDKKGYSLADYISDAAGLDKELR